MFELREAIESPAPAQRVFEFLTDLDRRPQWQRHLKRVEKRSDGPVGVGFQFVDVSKFGSVALEATACESPSHFAYRTIDGPFAVAIDMRLTERGAASALELSLTVKPVGGMRLLWPLMRFLVVPQVRKDVAALRAAVSGL